MISFDKKSTKHIWGHSPDGSNFYTVQDLLDSWLWKKYIAECVVACDGVELVCGNYLAFLCSLKRDAGSSRVVRADTAFELREFFKKSGVPVDDRFMARLENIDDRPVPKHAFDLLGQLRSGWLSACGSLKDPWNNTADGTLRIDVQLSPDDKFRDGCMYVVINGGPKDDNHPYVYSVSAFVKGPGRHAGEFTRDSADDVASFMEAVKKAQAWLEEKCRPPTLSELIPGGLDEDRLKETPETAQTLAMQFLLLVLDNDNLLGYTATAEGPVIKIEYAQDYSVENYSYEVSIKPGADGRMGYAFKMRWYDEETEGWTNTAEALCRILDRWPCSDE